MALYIVKNTYINQLIQLLLLKIDNKNQVYTKNIKLIWFYKENHLQIMSNKNKYLYISRHEFYLFCTELEMTIHIAIIVKIYQIIIVDVKTSPKT